MQKTINNIAIFNTSKVKERELLLFSLITFEMRL